MSGNPLVRAFSGLRARVVILLFAGLFVQAIGFEALLANLTRRWHYSEILSRHQALATDVANHVIEPYLAGDMLTLASEMRRAAVETDVLAIALYTKDGEKVVGWANEPGVWSALGTPTVTGSSVTSRPSKIPGHRTLEITAPVRWQVPGTRAKDADASPQHGIGPLPLHSATGSLGSVRVVVSTERVEAAVGTATKLGLLVLIAALMVGFGAVVLFVGLVVRPLREASELAGRIARGQLDHRLPVRSDDELGGLAASMNTMAAGLEDARRDADAEAQRLHVATEAVIAIANEARITHDPRELFSVVASRLRAVTGCEAVVLAVPGTEPGAHCIIGLDPPSPWNALTVGETLDREVLMNIDVTEAATRVVLDEDLDGGLARLLRPDGHRTALLVPLSHELGPPALLVLASRDRRAFPAQDTEIVAGLASHLSSALRAARLHESLEMSIMELDRTRDYLVQSGMLRVAGEMAAGVAHEFNNILGAVLGRAQLLRRDVEAATTQDDNLVRGLRAIEQVSKDGAETVRRLRLFGRNIEYAPAEPIEVDTVLRDAAEFTSPRWSNEALASGRAITIEIESTPGLWVEARPHELREVFTNVILNAADALPDGGTIRMSSVRIPDGVMITVTDDGIGMSETTLARLYEPFFTTKGESGSGLGMSVAYGIVQRHRGEIRVTSSPGQGTRVEVHLPLTTRRPAAQPVPGMRSTPPPQPLKILIIDDEAPVRDLLADIVMALGHEPTSYGTGLEAISAYVPGSYDLILTDVGMPGLTGWQIADVIRALDPDVMLVFVTGWADDVSPDALAEAAVDRMIAKPFSIEDVQQAIEATVARSVSQAA